MAAKSPKCHIYCFTKSGPRTSLSSYFAYNSHAFLKICPSFIIYCFWYKKSGAWNRCIFFPSTGKTQIYRPQPKLMATTQKVLPKPRTVRHIKFYWLEPSLNYISKNFTSGNHFLMINPMINLYQPIKPQ